jgi:hypothetical protein
MPIRDTLATSTAQPLLAQNIPVATTHASLGRATGTGVDDVDAMLLLSDSDEDEPTESTVAPLKRPRYSFRAPYK